MKERKRIVKIGNSAGVILPRWWIRMNDVEEVEMEIYADKIVIRKEVMDNEDTS